MKNLFFFFFLRTKLTRTFHFSSKHVRGELSTRTERVLLWNTKRTDETTSANDKRWITIPRLWTIKIRVAARGYCSVGNTTECWLEASTDAFRRCENFIQSSETIISFFHRTARKLGEANDDAGSIIAKTTDQTKVKNICSKEVGVTRASVKNHPII